MTELTKSIAIISSAHIRRYTEDEPKFLLHITDHTCKYHEHLTYEGDVTTESITAIMKVADAVSWDGLRQCEIRIAVGEDDRVHALGHIKNNLWLGPKGFGKWRDVSDERRDIPPAKPKLYILKVTKDQYKTLSGSRSPMLCPHVDDFSDVTGHPSDWLRNFLDGMNVNWEFMNNSPESLGWLWNSLPKMTYDTLVFIESNQEESGEIVQLGA